MASDNTLNELRYDLQCFERGELELTNEERNALIVAIYDREKVVERWERGYMQALDNDPTGQDLDVFLGCH